MPRDSRLSFQVDLFAACGPLPDTLLEANEREKDIRYSSRTRATSDMLRREHDLRHNIDALSDRLPPDLRTTPEAQFLHNFGCVTTMDIVQLIYRPKEAPGHAKDYEFGRGSMLARWARAWRMRGTPSGPRPGWRRCRPRSAPGPLTCWRTPPPMAEALGGGQRIARAPGGPPPEKLKFADAAHKPG